jgi:hypothetical protein
MATPIPASASSPANINPVGPAPAITTEYEFIPETEFIACPRGFVTGAILPQDPALAAIPPG